MSAATADGAGVQVFLRLRPTAERSDIELFDYQPTTRPDAITIKDPLSSGRCTHSYEFSGILGPTDGQERVFSVAAAPAVEAALQGRSSCVLAYGQTGSGKTFSVFGEGGSKRGLLPRAMERLFQAGASRAAEGSAGGIAVSFLEVYLDQIYDLAAGGAEVGGGEAAPRRPSLPPQEGTGSASVPSLSTGVPSLRHTFPLPKSQGPKPSATGSAGTGAAARPAAPGGAARGLEVHEAASGRVFVQGLSRTPAYSMADVHRIMERGFAARRTAATAANQRSSRSHTIFTVHLSAPGVPTPDDSQELSGPGPPEGPDGEVTLSFVDLAGSERLAKTKAEGERFREAVAINSSLTALGKVVLALATGERHVPYRDVKLTRILSGSLTGGAQVSLLATVHPRVEDYEESLNTLSFAHKCTSITRPQVSFVTQKSAESRLSELQAEAADLRALLARSAGQHCQPQGTQPWGASLCHEPTNPLPVEQLDEAIDSILAGATGGAAGGGGGLSGSLGVAMDPAVRCLAELREQRRCQAECQAKAERKMREMSAAKLEIGEMKACRQKEAQDLKHRRKALAAELECLKVELSAARAEQAAGHGEACRRAQQEADEKAEEVNRALQERNRNAVQCEEAVRAPSKRFEEEREKLAQRHVEVVRALKQQHSDQLEELEAQWRARLAAQDRRNRELCLEQTATQGRERAGLARCQAELLSLGGLVAQLAGLVAEVEDGLHPIMRQGGVKGALLPDGAVPPRPTRDTHPVLFDATASAEERVAALERAGGRELQPRTRLLSKVARGGLEGAEQIAAGASRSRPGSGAPRGDPPAAGPPGSAEAPRSGEQTPGFGASLRSEAAVALAEVGEDARWDAAALARDVCEAEADAQAEELLAGLPPERLRRLCAELRARALEAFDPDAEREAIRCDLARGLAGDATRQYVRQLERRRDEARAEWNVAAERERRLRGELELRRATLSGHPSRPCSAASHGGSAGGAPGGPRSRSLSRRHFGTPAGGAKPASAASTRAPSRGTACPSLPSATSRRGRPGTATTAGSTRPPTACGGPPRGAPCVAAVSLKLEAAAGVH